MNWKAYCWLFFLPVQLLLLQLLSLYPNWIEVYYSHGVFLMLSQNTRQLLHFLPFSLGDLLYLSLLLLALVMIFKRRHQWKANWKKAAFAFVQVLSVFYLLFTLCWGLNYLRVPLHEKLGIGKEYSKEELLLFTQQLISQTNHLQVTLTGNSHRQVILTISGAQLALELRSGYAQLAKKYPYFAHDGKSVKQSILSVPLTYMGFSGYINPFTNEAQVNALLPDYTYPATAAHEMAHQIGYASESEANFVGYLATIHHENPYIKYSGYCMALRYCLARWKKIDEKQLLQLKCHINRGVLKNFEESELFWAQHETLLEKGFHLFYDNFLKWNSQEDGMNGYGKFVNLLVNYYREKPLM